MEFTKEEMLQCISGELLAECIADKILQNTKDHFEEFDKALIEGMRKAARMVVDELIKEYDFREEIQTRVKNTLTSMTKAEVLRLIAKEEVIF